MSQKKILLLGITITGLIGGGYLVIQIKQALDEYYHWKSREAVLEKELDDLRMEVTKHRKFLDRLRTDPSYQEEMPEKNWDMEKKEKGSTDFQKKN